MNTLQQVYKGTYASLGNGVFHRQAAYYVQDPATYGETFRVRYIRIGERQAMEKLAVSAMELAAKSLGF